MKIGPFASLLAAVLLAAAPLRAQEHAEAPVSAVAAEAAQAEKVDIITPHITDGDHMEIPWILPPFFKEIHLPKYEALQFHVGGVMVDLSPTKHVYFLLIGATLLVTVMTLVARSHARAAQAGTAPKGAANGFEAMILYIRNEVILPNVGHHGEGFVPYLLTWRWRGSNPRPKNLKK